MNAQTPRNVPATEPEEPAWIGRVIDDRYRVVEHLGEGGMGSVWVAEHLKLRKEVALKVIHPEFAGDGEVAARFAREAMASAQLDHPHVASALDYGTLPEGGAYLVMQLVRGRSVHDLIEEGGAVPWQQACEIAAQVADALGAAHAMGIVHRDLKPDNVMLREAPDGSMQVKVLDFGIARVAMEEGRQAPEGAEPGRALTRIGTVMGTPGYMAPEQAMGEQVDARADIYALGVVLWEMIAGRDMFETRDLTAIVTRQLTEPAPPIAAHAPGPMPPDLDRLVTAMLASRPGERPSQATDVRDSLRRLVLGQTAPPGALHAPSGVRERTEGTAQTMLAKPASAPLTTSTSLISPGTAATLAATVNATVERIRQHVPVRWAAAGCAGLLLLAGLGVVGLVALGDDEPADASQPPAGFSLGKLLEMSPLPAPAPSVPPEVRERIDGVMEGGDRRQRKEAAEWLLAHEPAADVPEFARAAAELETARGCRAKKRVVERIAEEELVGALPALERIADTPRRGCGFLGVNDCYSCLRRDLNRAIGALGGDETDEAEPPEEPAESGGPRKRR